MGGNAHIEIVKRSSSIIEFLSRYGEDEKTGLQAIDENAISLIWNCQLGKHEEMVRTVYNLIQEVAQYLSIETINSLFNKIKEVQP